MTIPLVPPAPALAERTAENPAEEHGKKGAEDPLTRSLEKRLKKGSSLDDVMIDIRWRFEGEYVSVRLFGSGVGIWKREVLFRIPPADARNLIRKVAAAKFGALPDTLGEEEARVLMGRVIVVSGAVRKTVSQEADGPQSAPVTDIAQSLLQAGKAAAAKDGVRVSSFAEGFGALGDGRLAPEALDLFVRRKALQTAGGDPEDWDLRLRAGRVFDRVIGTAGHGGVTRALVLSPAEFEALARDLAAADLATLPLNLYSPIYTDLDVTLLNQSRKIQARQFAGMTAATHGAKQQAFDALMSSIAALHARAVKEGRVVEAVDVVNATREESREREKERKEND
jgi:hypothetical protein